jgi:Do/DeqQ family serine protease
LLIEISLGLLVLRASLLLYSNQQILNVMNWKGVLTTVVISAATAVASVGLYAKYGQSNNFSVINSQGKLPVNYAGFFDKNGNPAEPVDFEAAANTAIPTVVHIRTVTNPRQVSNNLPRQQQRNPFAELFGLGDDDLGDMFRQRVVPGQQASGSGVIISEDGYIVTNNHVIDGADEVNVTLSNKKSFKAKVVGADPSTDIAVLKIEGHGYPYLLYGNSDDVHIGQWVLAVGYPFTLETTVTAGIVSAKSRALGINSRKASTSAVESFIQTDAAVNPGNSGGALINTKGELIGINSAIASPTGSFAGYSFAIPINITKKIVNDIIQYGAVQRGYLGIEYPNEQMEDQLTEEQKKQQGIMDDVNGVYVSGIATGGAAEAAGLKKGDIITKINGTLISGGSDLQGLIARYKPGEKIAITYKRDGSEHVTDATLLNKSGTYAVVVSTVLDKLGAQFKNLDDPKAKQLGVKGGVVVSGITEGIIKDQTMMKEKFVILRVDGKEVSNVDQLKAALAGKASVNVEGIYPGFEGVYQYGLNDLNGTGPAAGGGDDDGDGQ